LVPGKKGDFAKGPLLVAGIAANERAKPFVSDLLGRSAELVPFKWRKLTYWAVFLPQVSDCLDMQRSEYWTDQRDNDSIKTVVFLKNKITNDPLFRLPSAFKYHCTDEFKNAVEHGGLTGLTFRLVWTDDLEPVRAGLPPSTESRDDAPYVKKPGRPSKRELVLRRIWEEVIDSGLTDDQLDEISQSSDRRRAESPEFILAGDEVLRRALEKGLTREELQKLCRSFAYRAAFNTLVALEEECALSRLFESLHEGLLMAGDNVF